MSTGFALNGTSKRVIADAAQLIAVLQAPIMASLAAPNMLMKARSGSNRWKVAVQLCAPLTSHGKRRNLVITALICLVQEVLAREDR